ncbi:group 1 truncated hemoglobin [Fretibacter rubidus]|uniref:group I truncated hemoglobin n=1 Tax=Fretibacter rubidus TaxID=570162 RepID=UPI003529F429
MKYGLKSTVKFVVLMTTVAVISGCQTMSPTASSSTLYDMLGGNQGVTKIVQGTLDYTLSDSRIAHTFDNSNVKRVETLLIEQICDLTDGPCEYSGQTMERSHRGLNLNSMHFNALVENMQKAMRDNNVPFRTQNQLLAILAPMHDDVVGRSR